MVDVPRFELGASSMPRKRASKLRHTPRKQASLDDHLRGTGFSSAMKGMASSEQGGPELPDGLIESLRNELDGQDAPFLKHIERELNLEWLPEEENRLGLTRFQCDHNEI